MRHLRYLINRAPGGPEAEIWGAVILTPFLAGDPPYSAQDKQRCGVRARWPRLHSTQFRSLGVALRPKMSMLRRIPPNQVPMAKDETTEDDNLAEDELADDELAEDELDDEEDLEGDALNGEFSDDEDDDNAKEEEDEDDDVATPARPSDDDDDEDDDDVEADLDAILKDRIAAGDDEEEDEEDGTAPAKKPTPAPGDAEHVQAKQENEFSCPNCFLLVNSAAVRDGECPHCGGPV